MPFRLLKIPLALLAILLVCTLGATISNAALPGGRSLIIAGQDPVEKEAKVETQEGEVAALFCEGDCASCDQKCPPADTSPVAVLENGSITATCVCVDEAATAGLRALIDELAESGELSDAGADKLRAAIEDMLARPDIVTIKEITSGNGQDGEVVVLKTIVSAEGKNAPQTIKMLKLDGDADSDAWNITMEGEDHVKSALDAFTIKLDSDSNVRTLSITTGEDGKVVVEGEGFSDEELEKIRQEVENSGAKNISVEIEDDVLILKTDGASEHPESMFLEGLPQLEGLERLKELEELGMAKVPELEGLERLKELQELGMVELPEMEGIERLKELEEHGMIAIPEMEGFLKLEELKELQGADVDKLLKLDEFNKLEVLKELGALEDIQELKQLENIDEEWAADLEAEIAAILKEVEALLREFAIHHSTD